MAANDVPALPPGFLPRLDLIGIKVTVTCSAPGCTPDSQCPDCRWIATGECFLCGGGATCLPTCPNRDDEWN